MQRRIGIVTTNGRGGVATAIDKLHRGLELEGHDVKLTLLGTNLLRATYNDAQLLRNSDEFDVMIYMNSTPAPDYLINKTPVKAVFIHGLIDEEIVNSIMHSGFIGRIRASSIFVYRKAIESLGPAPDLTIYQSETMRMANGHQPNSVLLPQYLLPAEIDYFQAFATERMASGSRILEILTYFPLVESSRLLRADQIISLSEMLRQSLKREFQITIVGAPFARRATSQVKGMDFLPRSDFIKLLARSDLYIERCTDEELGYTALEAGLLGVPVAKVTRPAALGRCDYSREQIINSTSLPGLAKQISDYFSRPASSRCVEPKKAKEWLISHRSWDSVKGPLLSRLFG
jgi:hypothetical protein